MGCVYENSESSEISETSETSDKMRWCPSFPSFSFRVFVLHYRKWGVFTKIRKARKARKARKHRTKWNAVRERHVCFVLSKTKKLQREKAHASNTLQIAKASGQLNKSVPSSQIFILTSQNENFWKKIEELKIAGFQLKSLFWAHISNI